MSFQKQISDQKLQNQKMLNQGQVSDLKDQFMFEIQRLKSQFSEEDGKYEFSENKIPKVS